MMIKQFSRISKLPQWAQDHIRDLEMRLSEARAQNDALLGKVPTDVLWLSGDRGKPLPRGSAVRFVLDPSESSSHVNHIDARVDRGELYINAGRSLLIRPEAANTIRLSTAW